MKTRATLKSAMTPFPYAIDETEDVRTARAMMEEHDFRHLPVTGAEGELVGVVSDRDLLLVRALRSDQRKETGVQIKDIMTPAPYVADIDARLDQVVLDMAEKAIGSALVTREGKLVGILTTTDVCWILGEMLAEQHRDDEVA